MHLIILVCVVMFTKGYELIDLEMFVENDQNPSPTIIPPDIFEGDGRDEPQASNNHFTISFAATTRQLLWKGLAFILLTSSRGRRPSL